MCIHVYIHVHAFILYILVYLQYTQCTCMWNGWFFLTHKVEVCDWENGLEFLSLSAVHDPLQNQRYALRNILVKEFDEFLSVSLV